MHTDTLKTATTKAHIPASWDCGIHLEPGSADGYWHIVDADSDNGDTLAVVDPYGFGEDLGWDVDAIARLVAAAPDLLAALRAALPAVIRLGDFIGNGDIEVPVSGLAINDRCAIVAQIRAALAKAEGK
jgi:hypothetical protein